MPVEPKALKLSVGMRRWNELNPGQQLAAVREICGTRGMALQKRFDGVIAVGAGFKMSAGIVSEAICLGLLVQKKRTIRVARPIPPRLGFSLKRGASRLRISVPTDVEELGEGEPHAVNVAQGIRAFNRHNPSQGVPGAACCLVEDVNQPSDRYVLSCRHVLALSLISGECAAFNDTDVADRAMSTRIGQLFFPLPMASNGQPCLDGAISLLDPSIPVQWQAQGVTPATVEPGVDQPSNCYVFTPNGPLPAAFVKEWANVQLQYANCGTVVIAGAYQFQADTVGGHSGSPVMTQDGTLFGMHFWGDPGQRLALAIPAFMLFQHGRFPVDIRLA